LRLYEGLFIFSEKFNEEELDRAVKSAQAEIEKHGGKIEGVEVLGRRGFARPLQKQEAGNYVRVTFLAGPEAITPLRARYRLAESVFRVQITRAEPVKPSKSDEKAESGAEAKEATA